MRTAIGAGVMLVLTTATAGANDLDTLLTKLLEPIALAAAADFKYPGADAVLQCKTPGSRVCVIEKHRGGKVGMFMLTAKKVLDGEKQTVVIDGQCASACAIFADKARSRVCITQKAAFLFHKSFFTRTVVMADGKLTEEKTDFVDPPQSTAIDRWVKANGGYPIEGFTVMSFNAAKQFWRVCEKDPPLPRPRPKEAPKRQKSASFQAHGLY